MKHEAFQGSRKSEATIAEQIVINILPYLFFLSRSRVFRDEWRVLKKLVIHQEIQFHKEIIVFTECIDVLVKNCLKSSF